MSDDPNTPKHPKLKKLIHILIHVLYLILDLMVFVAAVLNIVGGPSISGVFALVFFGVFISIPLVVIEIIYFCRLKKPCKTPGLVKRCLGFLTSVVGRGLLYQVLGFPFMMADFQWRWWNDAKLVSVIFGWIILGHGFCLMFIAICAKAYNFADWIEDEKDEGELRLESDDEDVGLLRDQGGLSRL
jgi:hypothetical protein